MSQDDFALAEPGSGLSFTYEGLKVLAVAPVTVAANGVSLTGLTTVGTANQLPGTNAAGTAWEYKAIATGTAGTDFAVVHTANTITFNLPVASAANTGKLSAANWTTFNGKADYSFGANVFSGDGAFTTTGVVTASFFQTSTAPTANSTGTVTIVAKDANLLTANAGWLPIKKSDGTTVYVPYWL